MEDPTLAPKLPDRYQTQVRLGRDGDIEEWLATDTALDRPVLIRALDPTATRKPVSLRSLPMCVRLQRSATSTSPGSTR